MTTETMMITKEEIVNYKLIPAIVDKEKEWLEKLSYALRLGNEFKAKTTLTFNTDDGEKSVETTVWSLMDKYIQLKGGILLPLKSIIDIHF